MTFNPAQAVDSPYDRGVKAYNLKNYVQALKLFQDAERSGRQDQSVYYYQALCWHQMKDRQHAKILYQFVLERFPGSPAAKLAAAAIINLDGGTSASAGQT